MIKWRDNLYLGEGTEKKRRKIISGIRKHKLQTGVYVIILSVNGKDTFDLIPAYMLSKDGYHGKDIEILGIAKGRSEACEVAQSMIMDVYNKTGDVDVRGFFS